MRRGIETDCEGFAAMVPLPSGDLIGDLQALLQQYRLMWDTNMEKMLEILPEMSRNPALIGGGHPRRHSALPRTAFSLFAYYQQSGLLLEESAEEAAFAFLGPSSSASSSAKCMAWSMRSMRTIMCRGFFMGGW